MEEKFAYLASANCFFFIFAALLPYFMEYLEKTSWLQKYKILNPPLQVLLSGFT